MSLLYFPEMFQYLSFFSHTATFTYFFLSVYYWPPFAIQSSAVITRSNLADIAIGTAMTAAERESNFKITTDTI